MSKRNRREHGRIISVETLIRGDALAADAAAGATSIAINDAGDFDEDGGWLRIGAQTIEYTACDDDTSVITLATALSAAGEEGDPVQVWSDLYDEVVDYQQALVELDGEYDNPDPVVAEVAEGVGDLPEGDRGKAGESCTLLRVADDEWEIVGVGGRSRKSRGNRWEQDDFYVLTAEDVAAGTATMPLSHRPCDEALTCVLAGVPQEPTEWTINYDAQTLTFPLDGWERAGFRLWVHYAYRKGVTTPTMSEADAVPNMAWYRLGEASGTTLVDSGPGGHHGTFSGGITHGTPGLFGASDTATTFNGTTGFAEVPFTNPDGYAFGGWMDKGSTLGAFTIAARIKPSSVSGSRTIVARHGVIWVFSIQSGKLAMSCAQSGTAWVDLIGSTTLVAGTEYRVAATMENFGKIRVYVDGVLDGEVDFPYEIREFNEPLTIGANYGLTGYSDGTPDFFFAGVIDEVKWFDYLVDPSAIGAL